MASANIVQTCPSSDCVAACKKLTELETWRADADVANAAYGRPPPTKLGTDPHVKQLVTDRKELAAAGLEPEDLVIPGTNFGAVVYKEGEPPAYTVGFRGTEQWLGADMKANVEQARGLPTPYYRRAEQIARKMELAQLRGSPGSPPTKFVGHSLGGGLASAAAVAVGSPATTFNAAGLHPSTVAERRGGSEIAAVYVKGEALTGIQHLPYAPRAMGTRSVPLDPPFNLTRDLLAVVAGSALGGPLGFAGAIALRSGLLHKMGNVTDSLDAAIVNAEADKREKCAGI